MNVNPFSEKSGGWKPIIATFIFCVLALLLLLFLLLFPVGTRNAQSDIKGGDQRVIALSRPHFILPREYHSTGGMNPINFWSFAADPDFEGNKIAFNDFTDIDGTSQNAAVQGFHINRTYSNPAHREDVMAIRVGANIFDYPTPGFQYSIGFGSAVKFHYLGQVGSTHYYYYPLAHPLTHPLGDFYEGIIQISRPFKSGKIEIVKSNEIEKWASILTLLRSIDLSPKAFNSLCNGKLIESRRFAQAFFGEACP